MITINKENLDETRIEHRDAAGENWPFDDLPGNAPPPGEASAKDATQRLFVDESISKMPPIQRTPSAKTLKDIPLAQRKSDDAPQQRPASHGPQQHSSVSAMKKKKQEKTIIIILISLAALLLLSIIGILIATLNPESDDGKIHDKVFAAGVNLGGLTVDQAKAALQKATNDTYSQLDMSVQVLDSVVTLTPAQTGAHLDVDAAVNAAYAYGRSVPKNGGSAPYTVNIVPFLSLDTDYIKNAVQNLGKQYSTTLSDTTCRVEGTRPAMNPDPSTVDTTHAHQTLYISIGNAEYGLNTDRLYEQILDAYNINLFQVTGECSVRAPELLDWDALFAELCVKPQDASMDPNTYQITPEVYGYGFTMNELNALLAKVSYGETLTIPLRYLEPDITATHLSGDLFKDILAAYQTNISTDAGWNANMQLVCDLLNGAIIKSGDTFSFNNLIGEPTSKRGFQTVNVYIGKGFVPVIGGGMSQVASTLYNCALIADLPIFERNPHTYVPTFIGAGLDAQVYFGNMDLQFTNNTEQPIRIEAAIVNGSVQITLVGTETKGYQVAIFTNATTTVQPGTDYVKLPTDPLGMYDDGDVLSPGIAGCTVGTFKRTIETATGRQISEELIAETSYAKRNAVVIVVEPEIPEVTDPTNPEETDPEETYPEETVPDETNPEETGPNETRTGD